MNSERMRRVLDSGHTVVLVRGDITEECVDAVVNAANAYLRHGAGVAGAIARKGGKTIREESLDWIRAHGPVSHRHPAITGAGDLPCRAVIHAVGPVWGDGEEDAKLGAAVQGALELAEARGFRTLALPAISTGVFGFPVGRAAAVILDTLDDWCEAQPDSALREIRLVLFDCDTVEAFREELER